MANISTEITRKLTTAVEKMPAFPRSVQRILEITRDINCQPKELVMVIEKDPVMTMKLLRVLNSAYYSLPKQIASVNQSVVYLGLNTVKNLALSFAAMGMLPQKNVAGFDIQRYLMHSLTTASLARMLCQRFGKDDTDPNDCYIAALLHDFGKVVFAQFMPMEFKRALALSEDQITSLHVAENRIIGADHSLVGAMLVEKWQLPKSLSDAISHHHDDIPPENTLLSCLFVANQISKKSLMGHSGNLLVEELPPSLVNRFGGNLDDIIARLGDLSMMVEEAESFIMDSNVTRWLPMQPQKGIAPADSTLPSPPIEVPGSGAMLAGDAQVIDLSILAKSVGNDPAKIHKFAIKFLESAQKGMAEIEAALERNDLAALAALGSRLKSSSSAAGALEFAGLCQVLAQCEDSGSVEPAQDVAAQLRSLLERIKKQIGNDRT